MPRRSLLPRPPSVCDACGRKECRTWICDTCKRCTCKGGCYYTPGRVVALLAALPYDGQQVTNPKNYGKSQKVSGNRMEGQWAIRADLMRALAYVAVQDDALTEAIVRLAYIGRPTKFPPGKYAGLSDADIAGEYGMDRRAVSRRRAKGLRLMVQCLNPDYREEGDE